MKESLLINGRGSISSLRTILYGLVYRNNEPYPTPVKRRVQIETRINEKSFSLLDLEIDVPKSEEPKIKLAGSCDNSIKNYGSVDTGLLLSYVRLFHNH